MTAFPAAFQSLAVPSRSASPVTPELPRGATGLSIVGPARVVLDGGPVPIVGSFRFRGPFVNQFHAVAYEIALVAVDATTHTARAGLLVPADVELHRTFIDPDEEGYEENTLGGDFIEDLAEVVGLPRATATYWVYAVIGDVVSNVVRVPVEVP